MIESIKEIAPLVAAMVAGIAGWWAWRTSLLKALSDRVALLEAREEVRTREMGATQARCAELVAELILERDRRRIAEREADKWQARWTARRSRQRQDSAPDGLEEDTSDADALDDVAADRSDSGLIAVPPGGMPK